MTTPAPLPPSQRRARVPARLAWRRPPRPGDVIALHAHRALWYAIPKVANSSVKAACAHLLSDELGPEL